MLGRAKTDQEEAFEVWSENLFEYHFNFFSSVQFLSLPLFVYLPSSRSFEKDLQLGKHVPSENGSCSLFLLFYFFFYFQSFVFLQSHESLVLPFISYRSHDLHASLLRMHAHLCACTAVYTYSIYVSSRDGLPIFRSLPVYTKLGSSFCGVNGREVTIRECDISLSLLFALALT